MLTDELRYKILKALENNPNKSQRALSKELGISLGKVNYCIKALLDVGWIKAKNFKNSQNKLGYMYIITPRGLEEKSNVTKAFLARKLDEAAQIEREIKRIKAELNEVILPSDATSYRSP